MIENLLYDYTKTKPKLSTEQLFAAFKAAGEDSHLQDHLYVITRIFELNLRPVVCGNHVSLYYHNHVDREAHCILNDIPLLQCNKHG